MRTTLTLLIAFAACTPYVDTLPPKAGSESESKKERWNAANNPANFDGRFNLRLAALPTSGRVTRDVWPSTYWPTHLDSINHRWQPGHYSPAEKYDMAFNGWTPPANFAELRPFARATFQAWDRSYYEALGPLASHVSQNLGNRPDRDVAFDDSVRNWRVPTWTGLCHAWGPVALLEDRPLHGIDYNGVHFDVGDLEALLIASYNRTPANGFIGARCETDAPAVERDAQGRATNVGCRDSNPGSLHVIATNYLGMQHKGFLFDRTFDDEVWNQPVVGYEITRQNAINAARANQLLGLSGNRYRPSPNAAKLYDVNLTLYWITESEAGTIAHDSREHTRASRYTYILEVDGAGKIIGGEYYGASKMNAPDFLWSARRLDRSTVPHLDLAKVRMLIAMSRAPMRPAAGNETTAMGQGGLAIPDNQPAGVTSHATVAGARGAVSSVEVNVDVNHTWSGDLVLTLVHNGVRHAFYNQEGGEADNIRLRNTIVAGFDGLDPNGAWDLHVADVSGQDVGNLVTWSVKVVSNASASPVAPTRPMETSFQGAGNVDLPDDNLAGISQTVNVTGVTGGQVIIELNVTHPYSGDINASISFGDSSWTLHSFEGADADDIHQRYRLDATGSAFTGNPAGVWTLQVADGVAGDTGRLESWSVIVTP